MTQRDPHRPGWRAPPARSSTSTTCPTACSRTATSRRASACGSATRSSTSRRSRPASMLEVSHVFEAPSLNPLLALGRPAWSSVRTWLTGLLTDETERDLVEPHLVPLDEVTLRMPFEVADYVDFYCSLDHATNVGRIFRPDDEPLQAQLAAPAGRLPRPRRHGRGLRHRRTAPARAAQGARRRTAPTYGPSTRLDIEAELGFVVGAPDRASASRVGVDGVRRPRLRA